MSVLLLPLLVVTLGCLTSLASGYFTCDNPSGSSQICGSSCLNVKPRVYQSLREVYLYNPLFVTFILESEETLQVDNICYTFFPNDNDPNIDDLYISRVFKNGTNEVLYFLVTNETLGVYRTISPGCNFRDTIIGRSPSDVAITYRCYSCNGCENQLRRVYGHAVYALSLSYQPIDACCLHQAVQVLEASGVPPQRYTVLPQKLPHRCIVSNKQRTAIGTAYSIY